MQRVVVFGTTGSGKSRLAEQLSQRTGLRIVELDALYWGRDWQGVPLELFRHRVEREIRDGGWIVVGNYGQVRDLVWPAADTLIWLDLPFPLVMSRLVRRNWALRPTGWWCCPRTPIPLSVLPRTPIPSAPSPRLAVARSPRRRTPVPLLLWALKTHRRNRRRFGEECASFGPGRRVVRLQKPRDVERFVRAA